MVIWRRRGWVVLPITWAMVMSVEYATELWAGSDYYYESHAWPGYLVGFLAAIAVGITGYLLNYRHRGVITDDDSGETVAAPSHTFCHIPVEYWAILLPLIFVCTGYFEQRKQEEDTIYLQAPQKGDMYFTNIQKLFPDADITFPYGIIKVVSVNFNDVSLIVGQTTYLKPKGPEKDIKNMKAGEKNYYAKEPVVLSADSIRELYKTGVIYGIWR